AAYMEQRIQQLGARWFQKARTFDFIDEAIAAGFKLKTTNPEELVAMRLMAGAQMRMNAQLLNDLFNMRQAIRVKEAQPGDMVNANRGAEGIGRQGWSPINGPDGAQWLISPEVKPIWNNTLGATSLWSKDTPGGGIFRGWMKFKNVWVPIRLSLSLFH